MSEYRISIRTLEQTIEAAFREGARYGEMRVMGSEGYEKFKQEAILNLISNAKTDLLKDARAFEMRGPFIT